MGEKESVIERMLREPKSITPQQRKNARYYVKKRMRHSTAFLKQVETSNDEKMKKFLADEMEREFGIRSEEANSDIPIEKNPEITIVNRLEITFKEESQDCGGKTREPATIMDRISGFLRR